MNLGDSLAMTNASIHTPTQPHPTPFAWGTRTFIMGIINVTPDSFSGDGLGENVDVAVEQGLELSKPSALTYWT